MMCADKTAGEDDVNFEFRICSLCCLSGAARARLADLNGQKQTFLGTKEYLNQRGT